MDDDGFLAGFDQLMSGKAQLMDELTKNVSAAHREVLVIAEVLRASAIRFYRFNESVELPFEGQFGDELRSPTPAVEKLMQRHKQSFDAFLSVLQRLKYDPEYADDLEISQAVADFEAATAHIPRHTSHH